MDYIVLSCNKTEDIDGHEITLHATGTLQITFGNKITIHKEHSRCKCSIIVDGKTVEVPKVSEALLAKTDNLSESDTAVMSVRLRELSANMLEEYYKTYLV